MSDRLLVAIFIAICRIMFRSAFTFHPEQVEALMRLDATADRRHLSFLGGTPSRY